jgi:Mg2+/Co2+ transporter CorC
VLKNRRDLIRAKKAAARERDLSEAISSVGAELAQSNGSVTRRNVEKKLMHLGFQVAQADSKSVMGHQTNTRKDR